MSQNLIKVFLVEDLKTDLELVKRQVLKYNDACTFTTASNEKDFLEKIEWTLPDVIISDYDLLDCNGLDILLHVKARKPDIPFIFVTGTLNNEEKVANAILEGADGFVLKNNMHKIPEVLELVLSRNNQRIEAEKNRAELKQRRDLLMSKLGAKIGQLKTANEREELLGMFQELQGLQKLV